jgi:hypothetical protein
MGDEMTIATINGHGLFCYKSNCGAWRVQRGVVSRKHRLDSWFESNPVRQVPATSKAVAGYFYATTATDTRLAVAVRVKP